MHVSRSSSAQPSGSAGPSATGGVAEPSGATTPTSGPGRRPGSRAANRDGVGETREAVPHRSGPEHDAWLAGWAWGDTQPDRRDPSRPASRAHARRRATDAGGADHSPVNAINANGRMRTTR